MSSPQKKIAIYGSRSQAQALPELSRLFSFLSDNGFRVFIHSRFYSYLEEKELDMARAIPADHLPADAGLVMSIGGDGTFLRTARWVGRKEIPILGVNTGHLGFLSSCDIDGVEDMMRNICEGNITIEKRMVIEVSGPEIPEDMKYALNEISLTRDSSSSMITVKALVNGNSLADYWGDGLIVATPTGSTAYCLSAGGPIIEPTIDCLCLCPVAPHTLTLRPFVAGADSVIELTPQSRSGKFSLSLDDRSMVLPADVTFLVKKAPFNVLVIRKKNVGFASILREKLFWGSGNV